MNKTEEYPQTELWSEELAILYPLQDAFRNFRECRETSSYESKRYRNEIDILIFFNLFFNL
jgi:hypothetical protein